MLSRIADSLYWMNRYMERADGLLRIASVHYVLAMDKDVNGATTWKPVLELFTRTSEYEMTLLENNTEEVLKKMLVSASNENSLKMIVNKARENARGAQDHITKEVWEEINQLYHLVNDNDVLNRLNSYQALDVMKELTRHAILYAGTIDITMPRGNGWYFMSMGRYVERCLQTIALTEKQLELMHFAEKDSSDILQWRQLLLSLSGYELHLKTYRSSNHNYNALHQVLINENFPRSLMYSFKRISYYLERLTSSYQKETSASLLRGFGRLHSKVRYMDLEKLNPLTIQEFLAEVKSDVFYFNKQLEQHFFSYS